MVMMPRYVQLLFTGLLVVSLYTFTQQAPIENQEETVSIANEAEPSPSVEQEAQNESFSQDVTAVEDDQNKSVSETSVETPQWDTEKKQVKPVESPVQSAEPTAISADDEQVEGIDTVDLEDPQGNWLNKRIWWERTEKKYEKIRAAVTQIFEMRTAFFAQRSELDKNTLDPFYMAIGIGQGELQEFLTEMIATLKEREKAETDPQEDEKIEDDIETIVKKRTALEDLKKEIDGVTQLDHSIDDAIMKLVEQINRLRSYEQQAWQNFKDIARVLDDKKARELYYKVDSAWRNVQEIQQYLQDQYAASFELIIEQVKKDIVRVQNSMELLKQQGLDLKEKIAQKNGVVLEPEVEQEEEEQPGLLRRFIINPIMAIFRVIGAFFAYLWDYFISFITWPFRKAEPVEGVVEEVVEVETESMPVSAPSNTSSINTQTPSAVAPAAVPDILNALSVPSSAVQAKPFVKNENETGQSERQDKSETVVTDEQSEGESDDAEPVNTLSLGVDEEQDQESEPMADQLAPTMDEESAE